jgi:hypothetical protein
VVEVCGITENRLQNGMGGGYLFFSTGPHTRATKHEAAHAETEAVAGTAVAACARAV